jgi:AraC family transcriptional regulator
VPNAVFESGHRGCTTLTHHHHASPFVTIVLSGGYVEVDDNAIPGAFRAGSVVVHEAGEMHADRFASDTRCLNVELPDDWRERHSPCAVELRGLHNAAQCLTTAYYRDRSSLPKAVEELRAALQSRDSAPVASPQWLQRVIDQFPWTDATPLREAAALAGLHETHFSRAFHRYAGMTASEYRARARVRLASQMLLGTTASVSRVAFSAGLSDQSHLTRLFSERLGVSPAAYRRTFAR